MAVSGSDDETLGSSGGLSYTFPDFLTLRTSGLQQAFEDTYFRRMRNAGFTFEHSLNGSGGEAHLNGRPVPGMAADALPKSSDAPNAGAAGQAPAQPWRSLMAWVGPPSSVPARGPEV